MSDHSNNAVLEALERIEVYYDRVVPWLAHMYDHKTGGFYMTMSGSLDPEMEPAVEMTQWGLSFLSKYAGILSDAGVYKQYFSHIVSPKYSV